MQLCNLNGGDHGLSVWHLGKHTWRVNLASKWKFSTFVLRCKTTWTLLAWSKSEQLLFNESFPSFLFQILIHFTTVSHGYRGTYGIHSFSPQLSWFGDLDKREKRRTARRAKFINLVSACFLTKCQIVNQSCTENLRYTSFLVWRN